MSDAPPQPPEKSHALAWALSLFAELLLYGLSLGPLVYLSVQDIIPSRWPGWLETLYTPVFWLEENTFLHQPIEAYLMWWTSLAAKP